MVHQSQLVRLGISLQQVEVICPSLGWFETPPSLPAIFNHRCCCGNLTTNLVGNCHCIILNSGFDSLCIFEYLKLTNSQAQIKRVDFGNVRHFDQLNLNSPLRSKADFRPSQHQTQFKEPAPAN